MSAPSRKTHSRPVRRITVTVDGVPVEISPELEKAVLRARNAASPPLPNEMTTNQAAEFLDVSRPFVIKLTKVGELPFRLVGKHRRIPSNALVEYRDKMFEQAREASNEMTRLSQEAGLYDEQPRRKAQ